MRNVVNLPLFLALFGAAWPSAAAQLPGLFYTNHVVRKEPWSIHIVRWERTNTLYSLQTVHAGGIALGLSTLTSQLRTLPPGLGTPVAAINGDFYKRDRIYAGDPRGLQVMQGDMISAPSGGVVFWTDALGAPHTTNVSPRFLIAWPDGASTPFGLNGERTPDGIQLYTSAIGTSTRTTNGVELVLERGADSPWLPLRIGRSYAARIREIHHSGGSPVPSNALVLSLGTEAAQQRKFREGDSLRISTAAIPAISGVKAAISGGPLLLSNGKRLRIQEGDLDSYEFSSMLERHPRSAIGWNQRYFYLVVVDGRQEGISDGMTLDELASYFSRLGCTDAMNLDGGGSATLWFDGNVRNSPCDGKERDLANCLVIVKNREAQ
jgi:hypothetical protein